MNPNRKYTLIENSVNDLVKTTEQQRKDIKEIYNHIEQLYIDIKFLKDRIKRLEYNP